MENDFEWHTGWPAAKGWYNCRIDGEEMRLYFFRCELKPNRCYWNDENGAKIDEDVEWRE